MDFDKIEIIKELGNGSYGSTYLVKLDDKYFALKKQKIIKESIKKNYKYEIWREIDFYKWINKLDKYNQIFFMKMYDYNIYECKYVNNLSKLLEPKIYNKLKKSPYCINILLELKDLTLEDLITEKKLEYTQRLSIIIQILYSLYLMHSSGYYHRDTHTQNIMINECDYNKIITLKINHKTYKLKTYGHIISLIDYGLINHKKYLTKKDYNNLKFDITINIDLFIFIETCLINYQYNVLKYIKNIKKKTIYLYFKKLYNDYYNEYLLLKIQYLGLWNDDKTKLWFDLFENNKLTLKKQTFNGIIYEMLQLLCIFNRKIYCKLLNIPYFDLFIDDEIVQTIKLNLHNEDKTIIYLLNLLN